MSTKKHLPELEGIRAYAFIIVFLVHYTYGIIEKPTGSGIRHYLSFLFLQVAWIAVPIFFVLSGYLITGVLYDTQEREGFFRVFYFRRALRILPLYYLTLAVAAVLFLFAHENLSTNHLLFLVYLQNFDITLQSVRKVYSVAHLWSLAVEEQFYLIWPLVIWAIRSRVAILRLCYAMIGCVCLYRILWPALHLGSNNTGFFGYYATFTRCDALLMGAALALHERGPSFRMPKLVVPAYLSIAAGAIIVALKIYFSGSASPVQTRGIAFLYPTFHIVSLAIVVLTLTPNNWLNRACRAKWACSLGSLSYGLYVYHFILYPFIGHTVYPRLAGELGSFTARIMILSAMWTLTYSCASLSYTWLEMPILKFKQRVNYGPDRLQRRRFPLLWRSPQLELALEQA